MATTKAQQKAVRKYKENNYERLEISIRKGGKELIKTYASNHGKSVNGLVNELLEQEIPTLKEQNEEGSGKRE